MVEQKEQKRCIGETALRGHYGGIVRRVVAITRQVREEQCKKQSSRFLHSSSLLARESIRVQTACIATCRALFAGWHLAAVYVAMHIMSRVQRERWFLALRPCFGQGLFFFPARGLHFCIRRLLHTFFFFFSIRLHICY